MLPEAVTRLYERDLLQSANEFQAVRHRGFAHHLTRFWLSRKDSGQPAFPANDAPETLTGQAWLDAMDARAQKELDAVY